MTKTEKAISNMEKWALDDIHGYDQRYRWGEFGDYDCSSAVIQSWENAGVPVKSAGASYTGNIPDVFPKFGFTNVIGYVNLANGAGLQRGDILLNRWNHVAMYCGSGKEVEASINEHGGVVGGQPGDQTGQEFLIRSYRNYPWDHVYRYNEPAEPAVFIAHKFKTKQIAYGDRGVDVFRLQVIMRARGYYSGKVSSYFNKELEAGVIKWQKKAGLDADGVFGNRQSWPTLLGLDQDEKGYWIVEICRPGMMGSKSVLLLQEMLKGLPKNYYKDKLDWNFGGNTTAALIAFKKEANKSGAKLTVNEVFDAETARYMLG